MRKMGQLITLWTALLVFPLSSFALGLGDIETSSFLNQPLKAEISVISARPGEIDDLLVSLASRDAFSKAGLERPAALSKIRFKVEKSEDGLSAIVHVSTKQSVTEPFLNFLIEADWAKGRLIREFTILLDPPYFNQQTTEAPPASSQPEAVAQPEEQSNFIARDENSAAVTTPATRQVESASRPIALNSEASERQNSSAMAPGGGSSADEMVVDKGDTLWGIASQFKDDAHSMAQVMLAMQVMNPDAFGRDNINNLKVGSVLRAPTSQMIDALSKQEAYAQVLEQNGLWDEYVARKSGAPVSGGPVTSSGSTQSGDATQGKLSLVTPGDGESTSASQQGDANSEDAGQIRKRLALAEEELEAARLENNDLTSRISSLEQQLSKFEELQKLVQIEDDSLAQLQEKAAQQAEVSNESMAGQVADQPTDVMIEAAKEMMTDQPSTSESESQPPMAGMESASTEAETVIKTLPETGMADAPMQDKIESSDSLPPAPVIVTESPSGGVMDMLPSMDEVLDDPVMLGAAGGILALLIGFLLFKRKKEDDDFGGITLDDSDLIDDDATPIHIPSGEDDSKSAEDTLGGGTLEETNVLDSAITPAEDEEDEFAKTAILSSDKMPEAEAPAQEEQDDVLNEVDVYLAYGLYDNAEELLNESIKASPDKADYRAKLLDTYFATKNKDAFTKEAENLKSLGGAANRFWDRVQIMGYELSPENKLFMDAQTSELKAADLEYAKPQTADFDFGNDSELEDLSNTDFNLGEDSFDLSDLSGTQEMLPAEDTLTETQSFMGKSGDNLDLPSLDNDETVIREEQKSEDLDIPDSIGDFDLDFDMSDDGMSDDDDAINFDLPDDLNLSVEDAISDLQAGKESDEQTEAESIQDDSDDEIVLEESDDSEESAQDLSFDATEGDALTRADSGGVELDLGDISQFNINEDNDQSEPAPSDSQSDDSFTAEDDDDALSAADDAEIELDLGDLGGESDGLVEDDIAEDESMSETLIVSPDSSSEAIAFDAEIEDELNEAETQDEPEFDVGTSETLIMTPEDMDFGATLTDMEAVTSEPEKSTENEMDELMDDDLSSIDLDISDMDDEVISSDSLTDTLDEGTMHVESALDLDMSDFVESDKDSDGSEDKAESKDEEDAGTMHIEAALDLDMSDLEDASLEMEAVSEEDVINETDDDDSADLDLTEQISSMADFDFSNLDDSSEEIEDELEIEGEPEIEDVVNEVDPEAGLDKTGTFAPGDFTDEMEADSDDYDSDDIEGLMLPDDVDEIATKLDLAKAFIDMGDAEGARSSLEEVLSEGSDEQKEEATGLLNSIK